MKSQRRSFSKKGGNLPNITGINDTSLFGATLISGDNVEKSDATCVPPPFGLNPCGPPVTPATLNEREQELLAAIQKDNQSGGSKSSKKGGKRKCPRHCRRRTRRTRRALRKALKHHKKSMKHHKKSMKHHKKSMKHHKKSKSKK